MSAPNCSSSAKSRKPPHHPQPELVVAGLAPTARRDPSAGFSVCGLDSSFFYFPALHGNAPANAIDAMYRVGRCAFPGSSARYFLITRTIWVVVTPRGTQAILSLLGTLSSSPYTRKPSVKPCTQPRHRASRWMPTASLVPSLPALEQTSKKSRPDRLISGCSAALF